MIFERGQNSEGFWANVELLLYSLLYRRNSARGREKIDLYLKRERKVDNMNESSHENRNSRVSYRDRVGENHRDSKQKD